MAQSLDDAIDALQGEDALMGAIARKVVQMQQRRPAPSPQTDLQRSAQRLVDGFAAGGVPKMGMRRQVSPIGAVTFTATSGTNLTVATVPTKNLIGRKLVVAVTRTGASATAAVEVGYFTIGSVNQFVTDSSAPAELFAPEVQGNNVDFDQAQAGVPIQCGLNLNGAALAGADTIRVSVGMLSDTIG